MPGAKSAKRSRNNAPRGRRRQASTDVSVAPSETRSSEHEVKSPPRQPESKAPRFLVAGVGASAGGLEAFTRLLAPFPADAPLAMVLVQHLSRTHPSLLPQLLAAKTNLVVVQASDGLRIEQGHVYVIPPDARMTVLDGMLRVRPRPTERGAHAPVDALFESLAEQYRNQAIGVVLSGSGHDGARGARLIKAAEGIVLVQDPNEAQSDGMPRATVVDHSADLVLPASEIADELLRLSKHVIAREHGEALQDDDSSADEASEFRTLFQLLRRKTGVDFTHYKPATIRRRVRRRMALHRVDDLAEYVKTLQQSPDEVQNLHDDVLIHVTGFFREPEAFVALTQTVLPQIIAEHQDGAPIRVWVPACSSGEEAYSVAITVLEFLGDRDDIPLQVFATDVSHKVIERARSGIYPLSALGGLSPEQLHRFFVKVDGRYRVRTTVRECCVFARQDITRDPPFSKVDLIVCRNLLIYLGPPLQRRVVSMFHYALTASGFLMLGRSETIGAHPELFAVADARARLYRRRPSAGTPRNLDFGTHAAPVEPQPALPSVSRVRQEPDVFGEASRLLLDRYAPPSIVLDPDLRIVHTRGKTAHYLELPNGDASLDVLKMVRSGLLSPLRSALHEARHENRTVRKDGVRLRTDGTHHRVNLEVSPIGEAPTSHFLVQFEDEARTRDGRGSQAGGKRAAVRPTATVAKLEEELDATRQHLHSMIQDLEAANEELQSANEEILSSNEELQSTNEELDTAREELQSTNEELSTVNDELQSRNVQLTEANGDLINFLASVHIPIVMVSSDLKIRRFTPAAERLMNLIASDVGRPIGHIKPNIRCPELEAIIRGVLDTMSVHEQKVQDIDGNSFILRVRPYKSLDNTIDGAVLALFDVSASLKLARETGEALMSRLTEPALLLDSEWVIQRANRAFYDAFRASPRETEGRLIFTLDEARWDTPGLRHLLQEILPAQKSFEGFPAEQEFSTVGRKRLVLDARRIESDRLSMILLVVREVIDG